MTKRIQHVKPKESSKEYDYSADEAQQQQVEDAKVQRSQRAKDVGEVAVNDELLDEIDAVLEENASAFVRAYRQKGGE